MSPFSEMLSGVMALDFGSSIRRSGSGNSGNDYLVIENGESFTISSAYSIIGVTINYTSNNYGCSGNDNEYDPARYSTSNPPTQSGTIYASSGTTGSWSGESTSIVFTMYDNYAEASLLNWFPTRYRTRIASIEVTYMGAE